MTEENAETTGTEEAAAKAAAEKEAADKAAAEAAKAAEADPDAELLKDARNPDAVKRAIQAERDNAKAAKKAAEDASKEAENLRAKVQEFEDRDKSEQEKAEQRAADAEAKAEKAEKKLLRLTVASEKKLPAELADRLQGETQAELEADADKLLKWAKAEDSVSVDGGARKSTKAPEDMNARIRAAAGR
jgi:hypothetical protein